MRAAIVKVVELHDELRRRARRRRESPTAVSLPHLWVLTPTLAEGLLGGFGARPRADLAPGCCRLPDELGLTLAVLADLPETPETLWLRLLARGKVQQRALAELAALPDDHPLKGDTGLRVVRWKTEAERKTNPSEADGAQPCRAHGLQGRAGAGQLFEERSVDLDRQRVCGPNMLHSRVARSS
ncbi:MAG: hypothetical protein MUF34_37975 [Polyangiaceae bacterium]|nr:hypothetical protein [Polyangiaceae bacterium]